MGFLTLPPELLLKSLEGLSVQDVVNAAQVCFLPIEIDAVIS